MVTSIIGKSPLELYLDLACVRGKSYDKKATNMIRKQKEQRGDHGVKPHVL